MRGYSLDITLVDLSDWLDFTTIPGSRQSARSHRVGKKRELGQTTLFFSSEYEGERVGEERMGDE